MRTLVCLLLSIILNGCATVYTVSTDSEEIMQEACSSECSIPRIYSGTAFDICGVTQDNAGQGGAIMFWDLFFSIPADSLILPYTIFMQIKEGSISNSEVCQLTKAAKSKKKSYPDL